jgi:hypothetical protein
VPFGAPKALRRDIGARDSKSSVFEIERNSEIRSWAAGMFNTAVFVSD